jgi:hypothetical protein
MENEVAQMRFNFYYMKTKQAQRSRSREATTVSETLEVFSEIMKSYPDSEGAAIDLFFCGPKSHAIAAAALVNVHANVRLVGRSPSE